MLLKVPVYLTLCRKLLMVGVVPTVRRDVIFY